METKHLSYFKVENFKRFDSLEVKDIGQFNLIVGDNNVGKTSLLEALLFDDVDYENYMLSLELLLENRGISIENYELNTFDQYISDTSKPLLYSFRFTGKEETENLHVSTKRRNSLNQQEINEIIVDLRLLKSPFIAQFRKDNSVATKVVVGMNEMERINYRFPFLGANNIYHEETVNFSYTISQSNSKREELIEQLRLFLPGIYSVEASNAYVSNDAIVIRERGLDKPRTIHEYGDGFAKYFRILLKMELATDGRLMIDEIDAGIHYSRMKEYLIRLIISAKNKNVQLFATTHSKECMEHYKAALEELGYEDAGRIIKLADTEKGIKSYIYNFAQFENALQAGSEIR